VRRSRKGKAPSVWPLDREGINGSVRGVSFGALYLIVGVVVAAINDYFDDIDTLKAVGEAAIAVLIWPLVLFGVDVNLR
jgi:hypothetical protein